jgi:hypothetical protein
MTLPRHIEMFPSAKTLLERKDMTTDKAIAKYGKQTCIDAFDLHKQGNGARTIGIYLNLTTAQADCAIDAGRDITKQEIPQ